MTGANEKKVTHFPIFANFVTSKKKKKPGYTVPHVYTYTAQLILQVSQVIFPT